MARKRTLPARLRAKMSSSGKVFYYYDTCQKPRKWLPLGADYYEALKQYADLEMQYCEPELAQKIDETLTFAYVVKRYQREVLPRKSVATQQTNERELEKLLEFFNHPPAPINAIRPMHIREYLNWRSKKAAIRANREVALFSHIFNKAREWGYTDNENPVRGVKKNTERGRDVYVSDEVFWRVFEQADRHIRQLMLVAYLCSQRVADTLKLKLSDFHDDALWIQQNKTGKKLRVALIGVFADVVKQILDERGEAKHDFLFSKNGQPISYNQLRYGMDKARRLANVDKAEFQFRDLRAKAGTDKDEELGLNAAMDLLGHKNSSMTVHYVRHRKGKLVSPTRVDFKKK
ncbi:tyrosine-type recombinase/integrase [Neisseriaceae bacterium B1]